MTKNATGLGMSRKDNVWTCSWKKGEKYDKGQQFSWKVPGKAWTTSNIASDVTKKTFTVGFGAYYPNKMKFLTSASFRVRGKKGNKWSGWESKTYTVKFPNTPTAKATPNETEINKCAFGWAVTKTSAAAEIFTDVEWQAMLLADSNVGLSDGKKLSWKNTGSNDWKTGTSTTASSSTTIVEGPEIAQGSHTRWFRVRARGPRGASAWAYAKRTYAMPYQIVIDETSATNTANGYQVYVQWAERYNYAYPIDQMTVDYTMATPDPGLVCPAGATPTTAATLAQNAKTNAASFSIDTALGRDEALYVRVNSIHLSSTTPGDWTFVTAGALTNPTLTNVVTDPVTFKATISATNNSTVSDSFLAVLYRTADEPSDVAVLGIIPNGSTSVTVQCPDWTGKSIQFGVYAVVGNYEPTVRADGVGSYEITAAMESDIDWQAGTMPDAPASIGVAPTNVTGSVKVTWDWSWDDADSAIISWADHPDAWASTDEPSEYTVSNIHAAEWTIAGLETGIRWYIRVRLAQGTGDNAIYGPWSKMAVIDLSSAPSVPSLTLSSGIIPVTGSVSCYWAYVSTDGSAQAYAEISEAIVDSNGTHIGQYALTTDTAVDDTKTYYDLVGGEYVPQTPVGTEDPEALGWYEIVPAVIAHTQSAQHITLYAEELGWDQNETHYLAVSVVSGSGRVSDEWSNPVPVTIAAPLTAAITSTSLVPTTETVDGETRTYDALTLMPLDVTITGAGAGGTTTLVIERAADYHIDRPDGTDFNGYEGETICVIQQLGEDQITVERDQLIGSLDDGAPYRLVATVEDGLGQADTVTHDFEVNWAHQAVMPEGTVEMDGTVAKITPTEPVGYLSGDTCDIYRLSVDRPELIVEGADFETTYVDPYPTIGEYGGHRIVYRTYDGDYITADNEIAWLDLGKDNGDNLDVDYAIINYAGEELAIKYNLDVSNTWTKDFKETTYLGGSVQGDWNKGYSRTGSLKGLVVTTDDPGTIQSLKLLAIWDGLCHIRTPDGSSYPCNIDVSDELSHTSAGKGYSVTLTITRVDSEELDGQTYSEWSYEGSA